MEFQTIKTAQLTSLPAYEGKSGSRDRGDPLVYSFVYLNRQAVPHDFCQTSNVFVANLPANISEMSLGNFFAAKCGPVGSVSYISVLLFYSETH